jgi:hypothetical protein
LPNGNEVHRNQSGAHMKKFNYPNATKEEIFNVVYQRGTKFDWDTFAKHVRIEIAKHDLQNKEVCMQLKILPSTLTRVLSQGKKCDIDTVIKLCKFLLEKKIEDYLI